MEAHAQLGHAAEATPLIIKMLSEVRGSLAKEHPDLARPLLRFGRMHLMLKQFQEAEPLLRESLALQEKHAPGGWTIALAKLLLAEARAGVKDFAEAELLFMAAEDGLAAHVKELTPDHIAKLTASLDRMSPIYKEAKREDDGKRIDSLRQRLLKPRD
jgi:tetratricopeptide (TPR) repeat protein